MKRTGGHPIWLFKELMRMPRIPPNHAFQNGRKGTVTFNIKNNR
jgi:hypothetical protein